MPAPSGKNVQQSGLFKKLGAKLDSAVKTHAADETKYGIIQIPPGISNGIAKLIECKFDLYKTGANQGQYYFRAAGVIVSPESVMTPQGEMKVAGLQTSIMITVCDTKNNAGKVTTLEEHVASILNEMRKLAGDDFTHGKTGADLEPMAEALKEAGPFFKFTTSVRKAQTKDQTDGVWENWHGSQGLEDYTPPQGTEVVDNSGVGEPTDPEAPASVEGEAPFNEFGDLDSLAEKADKGDATAINELVDLGTKAGLTDEQMTECKDYMAVAALILASQSGAGEAAEVEAEVPAEEEFKPAKGDPFKIEVDGVNAKKQKIKKKIDVEVLTVDEKTKQVTLIDTATKKPIQGADKKNKKFSYDDLLAVE